MPANRTRNGGRPAGAVPSIFVALFALVLAASCESTPCVGDACPAACNGVDCTDEAPPAEAGTPGRFTPCRANDECDEASGFACVEELCRHPCRSHFDCGGVSMCESLGGSGKYCALTSPPTEPGGFYSRCANGVCARGFTCIGAGVGDTESYCTTDCANDDGCPTGFHCDAIDASTPSERMVCRPRGFCADCATDADCLAFPEGVCARDANGERHCTERCDFSPSSCPWAAATDCVVVDEAVGPTCQHRFGACRGDGRACEPCARDRDCPNGYCLESGYSGERWCIDQSLPCSCEGLTRQASYCAGSADCPASPSGNPMVCYDPGAFGGGVCVGVNLPQVSPLSCWR